MKHLRMTGLAAAAMLLAFLIVPAASAAGGADNDITGWERDSDYNRLYNVENFTKIKGELVDIIDIQPMEGMAPGLGMVLRLRSGEMATVHVSPKWFAGLVPFGFKIGDPVNAKGCWAELNNEKIFMASKIRNGEYFEIKFRRTSDGTPYWTLTPEDMVQEKLEE